MMSTTWQALNGCYFPSLPSLPFYALSNCAHYPSLNMAHASHLHAFSYVTFLIWNVFPLILDCEIPTLLLSPSSNVMVLLTSELLYLCQPSESTLDPSNIHTFIMLFLSLNFLTYKLELLGKIEIYFYYNIMHVYCKTVKKFFLLKKL